MKFNVRRGNVQTPNSLDVRLYNVSDNTAKALMLGNLRGTQPAGVVDQSPEFKNITLSAGYRNAQNGLIFQGAIIQCRYGRESPADTYLDIRAADGDSAYNYAVINTNLVAGSTPTQQLNVITKAAGVSQGFIPILSTQQLPRGKVFFGMVRDSARDHAQTQGANWSIEDGQYQMTKQTQFVPDQVVVLNSATGMINWPEQTANGIHVRSLLNSNLKIGRVIQIDNKSILNFQFPLDVPSQPNLALVPRTDADGYYVVWFAEHTGDTRGNEWYTDVICLRADTNEINNLLQAGRLTAAGINNIVVKPYG